MIKDILKKIILEYQEFVTGNHKTGIAGIEIHPQIMQAQRRYNTKL